MPAYCCYGDAAYYDDMHLALLAQLKAMRKESWLNIQGSELQTDSVSTALWSCQRESDALQHKRRGIHIRKRDQNEQEKKNRENV